MKSRRRKSRNVIGRFANRKAAAAVELAVCLPVIVLLAIGSIESASMIFLRQTLVQSAYETAKEAVKRNVDQATAFVRGRQVLEAREVSGETITFDPPVTDGLDSGTRVTVTVTAPGDENSILPFGPFRGRTISVSAVMIKE